MVASKVAEIEQDLEPISRRQSTMPGSARTIGAMTSWCKDNEV